MPVPYTLVLESPSLEGKSIENHPVFALAE